MRQRQIERDETEKENIYIKDEFSLLSKLPVICVYMYFPLVASIMREKQRLSNATGNTGYIRIDNYDTKVF